MFLEEGNLFLLFYFPLLLVDLMSRGGGRCRRGHIK
jgi:hypothetical protein